MKKTLCIILFVLVGAQLSAQTDERLNFVNAFLENVTQHDEKAVLKQMEKRYRKEQIKFLGGNTTQFLDELLSGQDMATGEWKNIKFRNILKIEVSEIVEQEDGNFEYIFRVRTESEDILRSVLLHAGKKFGFEGARG